MQPAHDAQVASHPEQGRRGAGRHHGQCGRCSSGGGCSAQCTGGWSAQRRHERHALHCEKRRATMAPAVNRCSSDSEGGGERKGEISAAAANGVGSSGIRSGPCEKRSSGEDSSVCPVVCCAVGLLLSLHFLRSARCRPVHRLLHKHTRTVRSSSLQAA